MSVHHAKFAIQPKKMNRTYGGILSYLRIHSYGASCALAALTIFSGVKPNLTSRFLSGADVPKVCIPMTVHYMPTYWAQPIVEACSTATRTVTSGGRTCSR